MAATLSLILISSLLQGALCGTFGVTMPQNITVLSGSCVTIPCSFDVDSNYETYLNNKDSNCKGIWSNTQSSTSENAELTATKEMTGDLTKKDCTTTFNNANLLQSDKYYFRVECGTGLKYTFKEAGVHFSFTAVPPTPTLTPSTLEVKEGTSVSLTCSAPAPCWSHPPALTWTPNLGQSQETLQEKKDKTKVKTSVVNFTASHLHRGKNISCTAVYKKQDGSTAAETSLTPVISYSPKNITVSVSPSGPAPDNSNVTLTCSSNANPAVRNYTWYRADGEQETFIGTGTSLNTEVSTNRRTFFCKAENEIGVGRSNQTQVEIQFPPQILLSSACSTTASQVSCSCETVGNPSPTVQWYLSGLPVNQSHMFEILSETLNSTVLRSFFTLNQLHKRDLSTVICRSFNSLGSASQQFCVSNLQVSAERQDSRLYPVIISTLAVLLLILICVLLFIIRAQKNHCEPKVKLTNENNTVAMSQLLTNERNEAPNTAEESIYANTDGLREADTAPPANTTNLPSTEPNKAGGPSENSDKKGGGCEAIYSNVILKTKSKKNKEEDMNPPGSSYLEEEKCMVDGIKRNFVSSAVEMGDLYDCVEPRNVRKAVECEYAQVTFRSKSAIQK